LLIPVLCQRIRSVMKPVITEQEKKNIAFY
jgi:hypothetical protein